MRPRTAPAKPRPGGEKPPDSAAPAGLAAPGSLDPPGGSAIVRALEPRAPLRGPPRRGARAVDRGGLENRCACKGTVGSNPTPSAILLRAARYAGLPSEALAKEGSLVSG